MNVKACHLALKAECYVVFAGFIQLLLSRVVRWLRPYLPTELAGFAMLMSGFTLAVVGFNYRSRRARRGR